MTERITQSDNSQPEIPVTNTRLERVQRMIGMRAWVGGLFDELYPEEESHD